MADEGDKEEEGHDGLESSEEDDDDFEEEEEDYVAEEYDSAVGESVGGDGGW